MLETKLIVVQTFVEAASATQCFLCAAPIPAGGPPLCPLCLEIEAERDQDYRDEKQQARRPF